ncbi:hypothetical protein SAMN02745206_03443 [Desulfacinum infernum DSM 9756]|uniref:Uncharacterized protein n=3 Tax=Desulfacinum infernum TaxID=35837 RepID=A0A1M5HUT6_9BACT|nr:hypothetical protein [Desulfacinum infernum]SHG19736.1 hypothetical protein SAMN02745206_03443 [Desulfacinum infernum DSM 9756]
MCESLVHKVGRSKQLEAVADPGLLPLFEDWLDELERETASFLEKNPGAGPADLADALGLSRRGASFLLAKARRGAPSESEGCPP